MPEEQHLGYLMNGLSSKIKQQVRIHKTVDVSRAVQLAMDIEEEILQEQGNHRYYQPSLLTSVGGNKTIGLSGSGPGWVRADYRSGGSYNTTGPRKTQSMVSVGQHLEHSGVNSGRPSSSNPSPVISSTASSGQGVKQLPYADFMKQKEQGKCF